MPNYGHVSLAEEVIESFQRRLDEVKNTLNSEKLAILDSANVQITSYRVAGAELIELEYLANNRKSYRYIHPSQFDLRVVDSL